MSGIHSSGGRDSPLSTANCWLYRGTVLHRRVRPVANAFRYRVFFLKFPLHRAAELVNAVFSVDRFNLLSFHHADHGDGGDLQAWVRALLAREGISDADGEVWLQCFPRVLGYVFNPVSFWYCHRADGACAAIIAEVNNTFGERHCYLLRSGAGGVIAAGELLTATKVFHVSPFCAIEGGYRFRFHRALRDGITHVVARIDHHDDAGTLLTTSISGAALPFRASTLLATFLRSPLMTLGVMARIHVQALRLWLKGVPFFRKPARPDHLVTR